MGLVLCQHGSQQSVSELERVTQKQCGIITSEIMPNTVVPTVNSNVKCSLGKFSLIHWKELVDLMVMKNFFNEELSFSPTCVSC